jgi:flagellar hook-associated protein 2
MSISSTGTLSSAGLGSGLDVNTIVSKLMQIEQQPLNKLNSDKSDLNTQLSAYGQISSALDSFTTAVGKLKSASGFSAYKVDSSVATVASATVDSTALAGSHTVSVSALAQSQIQAGTQVFATTSDALNAAGTLSFTQGANSFSINVDATDSLQSVQSKINSATDNTGISASILNDGTGNRLVLTSKNGGTSNSFTVEGDLPDTFGFNNNPRYDSSGYEIDPNGSITQNASDAQVMVDGVPVTATSNTISAAIPGVTLTLKSVGDTTINTSRDTDSLVSMVKGFTDAFNSLQKTIDTMQQKGGTLEADNTATSILNTLQDVFNSPASIDGSSFSYLAQIGVTFQKDGSLAIDTGMLTDAFNNNFDSTVSLLSDSNQGFASRLYDMASSMTNSDGLITTKKDSINSQLRDIDDQTTSIQAALADKEASLRAQFASLDALLGSMQQTSKFLASKLG